MPLRICGFLFILLVFKPQMVQAQSDHQDEVPIVLMAGGYASCPDQNIYSYIASKLFLKASSSEQMYLQFQRLKMAEYLEQQYGQKPIILFTCYSDLDLLKSKDFYMRFGKISNLSSDKSGKRLSVITSKHYKVTHFQNFSQIDFKQDGDDINFLNPLFSFVQEKISFVKSQKKKAKLFLLGHSYGGFITLHMANHFREHLKGVATADPISPLKCIASDMVFDPIGTFITGRDGCQSAPNDPFSQKAVKSLMHYLYQNNDKDIWWFHAYQRVFSYLRSAAIIPIFELNDETVFADFPKNIEYKKYIFKSNDGDAHSQLARLNSYWNDLFYQFISKY